MSTLKLPDLDPTRDKQIPPFAKKPFRRKLFENAMCVWRNVTVEPLIAGLGVCDRINGIAIQNLNLDKACRNNLHYGAEICSAIMKGHNLNKYKEHQKNSQALVAEMQIWSNFFLYLFPPLLLLFIGAYTDRTSRRKTFIMVPFIGYIVMSLGLILSSYFFTEIPLVYNGVIGSVFPGLFGHWIVFYMAIFAYISAITSTEDRTFRIGLVSTTSSVFNLLGSAISGVIVRNFGYIGTFSVVLLIYVCCFLYALFCIPEVNRSNVIRARSSTQKGSGVVVFLREFFDSANVRNTFVFLFRGGSCKEDPKRRTKLILIMIIVVVLNGPYQGEFTVMYLYTRLAFRWNEYNYSTFYTAYYFTDFLGSMFSVSYFTKYLKLNDSLVGVISVVSTLFGAIIFAFANTSFIFCFGAVASLFSNASFIAMRAIISKLTSAEELGKVMSAFMLFEAIAPMIYNPIYNAVYTATLDFMPSTFLLMSLVLTSPALFIFLWIYYHDKKLKDSSKQDNGIENPDPS